MSAALWDLHTESIKSVSGEFKVAGIEVDSAAFDAALRAELGDAYMYSEVHDDVHSEFVCTDCKKSGMGVLGIIAAIVVMVIAFYAAPAIAGAFASAAGAGTTAAAGATAATATTAAAGTTAAVGAGTAASTAAASTWAVGGLANTIATGATTSFLSSTASQAITTGRVDFGKAGEAAIIGGVTAGIGQYTREAVKAEEMTATTKWLIDTTVKAGINTIGGTSFGDALANELINTVAAKGAGYIGDGYFGEAGSAGHALAHGALGAIIASARGQDAVAGAIGGLGEAMLSNQLSGVIIDPRMLEITVATLTGAIAQATGHEGTTAMSAAQNAFENNWLAHEEAKKREAAIERRYQCTTAACAAAADQEIAYWNTIDRWRDQQTKTACLSPASMMCQA